VVGRERERERKKKDKRERKEKKMVTNTERFFGQILIG
jgi:hypothetical protein